MSEELKRKAPATSPIWSAPAHGYALEKCGRCGTKLELVRPGKHQCNYCESPADYFAVYVQRGPKARANFLCHVHTRGGRFNALRVARNHGHKLPRWSYAARVGKDGYFAALAKAFSA
jgi:hypothetical protein